MGKSSRAPERVVHAKSQRTVGANLIIKPPVYRPLRGRIAAACSRLAPALLREIAMPATALRSADAESDTPSEVAALLRAAVNGDSSAWTEIVLRYGRLVTMTVHSFRLQDADALD